VSGGHAAWCGNGRGTQRYLPLRRTDEDQLTQAILALAAKYGRYGYRRITVLLRDAGWQVGKDRLQRIWRREGLKNADYQYGKRRLRQIDGRIRFLTKRIEAAEVVDPEAPRAGQAATRAFFGATVRSANAAGVERVVSIVGTDEIDLNRNHISWVSPLGRALMKSAAGDSVVLQLLGRIPDRAGSALRAHFCGTVP